MGESGISFVVRPQTSGKEIKNPEEMLIVTIFYIAMAGSFCCFLQTPELLLFTMAGLFPIVVCIALRTHKKVIYGIAAALVVLVGFYSMLRFDLIADGARYLINNLYAASEAEQAYRYQYLTLQGAAPAEMCASVFLTVISLLLALVISVAGEKGRTAIGLSLVGAFAILSAYFGILPDNGWFTFWFFASVLLIIRGSGRRFSVFICSAALVVVVSMVVMGTAFVVVGGENPRVSQTEEELRDYFALSTVRYDSEMQELPGEEKEDDTTKSEAGMETEGSTGAESVFHRNWRRIFLTILFILLIALLLFIPAVLIDRINEKRTKNLAGIDSEDHRVAVRSMFRYTNQWLLAYGIVFENEPYSEFVDMLSDKILGEYADKYKEAVFLWQEAAFSSHEITKEQRREMWTFMEKTISLVWERATCSTRIRMKYRYALTKEVKYQCGSEKEA